MTAYSFRSTIHRRISLLRRGIELVTVLFTATLGTLIHLAFGWVALLFGQAAAGGDLRAKTVAFPVTAKSSKQF